MADSDITILPVNRQSFASRASYYIEQFIPVFPCRPDRRPYTTNGFHDASFDPAVIAAWSRAWPDALVGVPMGKASGLWALDVDMKKGRDGFASLASLNLDIPITRRYRTTSGGEHVLFRYPAGVDLRSTAGKLGEGLDTRGEGGYVVDWSLEGLPCENPDALADIPPALLARLLASPGDVERVAPGAHELTGREARSLLAVLDPDMDYGDWVKVGQALHYDSGGSAKALALWEAWSAKGEKWEEGATAAKWRSFHLDRAGPVVGAGTLRMMARAAGVGMDFDDLADTAEVRFPVIPACEFSKLPPPEWIIRGVLPRANLVVLFGESTAGKSFVALDMAASIALGKPWRGLKTKPGRVVYIAAEGEGGFRQRIRAYELHHGIEFPRDALGVIAGQPNLMARPDASAVANSIGSADVVIVDTFAQTTPGANENSGEDVGKALVHCREIGRATGAVVVLVHHAGKDLTKGARGWSGLRAAADAEIEVSRSEEGERAIRISKQKDAEDGKSWGFQLYPVVLGVDEDGEEMVSCVVEPMALAPKEKPKGRPSVWAEFAARVVGDNRDAWADGVELLEVAQYMAAMRERETDGEFSARWVESAKRYLVGAWADHFKLGSGDSVVPLLACEEL